MRTELLTYHRNSAIDQSDTKYTAINRTEDDVKHNTETCKTNPAAQSFDIDLQRTLSKWKAESLVDEMVDLDKIYKYHYHIILLLLPSIFQFMPYLIGIGSTDRGRYVFIETSLLFTWTIIVCVISIISYFKKDNNKSFFHIVNIMYGIANSQPADGKQFILDHNILSMDHKYYGIFFCTLSFYRCICLLIWEIIVCINKGFAHVGWWIVWREIELVEHMLLVCGLFFFFASYYEISSEYRNKINGELNIILNKYSQYKSLTKLVNHNIASALVKWQSSKRVQNRNKMELFITTIICIGAFISSFFFGNAAGDILIHRSDYTKWMSLIIFAIFFRIINCVIVLLWLHIFVNPILYHFQFSSIIMDELSEPLNTEFVDEFFGWWELRKYYINCAIKIYSSSFSGYILIFLTLSLISLVAAFRAYLLSYPYQHFVIFCFLAAIYAFSFISVAVEYNTNQLRHEITLNNERLRYIKKYNDNKIDANKLQTVNNLIDVIITNIQQNSESIKALGIKMNENFILLLRGATSAAVVVFIGIAFK